MNPAFNFNQQFSNNVTVPVFGLPYDTRFITNSLYTGYHRFGSDPLFNRDVQNVNQMEHWGTSVTVDWQISDNVQFKSITSCREFENTFGRDSDGTPLPVDHTWDTSIHEQTTQEFQITGLAADGRLDWATGLFLYEADDSNQGWNFLYPFILSTNNHKDVQTIDSKAVFFHATYDFNDVLSLTAGVRFTDDEKVVNVFRQDFRTLDVIIPNTRVTVDAQETSPKIGLNWQLKPNLMTYVQWATGFRGGGFGPRPANPLQVAAFDVETNDTLEGGVKIELNDGKLRLNSAVFFSESKNQQQGTQEFDSSGAIWFRTVNTGKSEYQGIELEVLSNPFPQFQLEAPSATSTTTVSIPAVRDCAARYRTATSAPRRARRNGPRRSVPPTTGGSATAAASRCAATPSISRRCSSAPTRSTASKVRTRCSTRGSRGVDGQRWSMAFYGTNLTTRSTSTAS